jgi:vitamin B12 transporter
VTAGLTQFEFLPIDQIERVEIIRGPQSSLYGSEAIGGVIQIFTRKAKNASQTPKVTLDAGGGSYYTSKTAGTVSGKINNSWYNIGASHFDTAGFNAKQPDFSPYGVNQPDKDGFQNTGVNARAGHHFNNNADLEAFFIHSEGTTHFDGSFQDKTNFINQTVGTEGSIDVMQHWRSTLRLGQTLDQTDSFAPITHKLASRFDTTRWNASWLNQFHLSDNHQFTTGADYRFDEIDSDTQFVKSSRYDVGVFGELHSRLFDNHLINASMRFDNNESFGNYVTGSAGWRYNWDYGISLLANFGNAFNQLVMENNVVTV